MPLPKVGNNESKEKFLSRCMMDIHMNKEFENDSQRFAVCQSIYEDRAEEKENVYPWKKKKDKT